MFRKSRQQDNEVKKGDTSLDERELHKKALGIVIRKVRKEYGWKQEEMEEYTNLSETMIGKLERGEREPLAYTLYKISRNSEKFISIDLIFQMVEEEINRMRKGR